MKLRLGVAAHYDGANPTGLVAKITGLGFEALEGHVGGGHDLFCHATHYTKRMFDPLAFGELHRSGHRFPA